MRGVRHSFVWGALLSVGFSFVCAAAGAQTVKRAPAQRIQSINGADTYKAYCAVCHGDHAKGNGPAASALKTPPADLTTIAKRHGGTFSATDVEAVITGSQVLASHGTREMPMWGPVFSALAPDQGHQKLRLTNLVDYLKSIQTQ